MFTTRLFASHVIPGSMQQPVVSKSPGWKVLSTAQSFSAVEITRIVAIERARMYRETGLIFADFLRFLMDLHAAGMNFRVPWNL